MRAIVQRVSSASVQIDGDVVGEIGVGFLLLVGIHREDSEASAIALADRVAGLRIMSDADGKMNLALSAIDPPGEILAISNFTVYGDASKSRRPSFTSSAGFEYGKHLFDLFLAELRKRVNKVETGVFGADMKVSLVNDGPVTMILEA